MHCNFGAGSMDRLTEPIPELSTLDSLRRTPVAYRRRRPPGGFAVPALVVVYRSRVGDLAKPN